MSVLRQILVLIVLAAAVTAGGLWYAGGDLTSGAQLSNRSPEPLPIEVAPVAKHPVRSIVEAVGTTRASQSINVVPTVSGRVARIEFDSGQRIRAGDLLIALDDASERAAVAEAEALLEDARQQLERARQLVAKQTVAKARVDELRAQFLVAEARRDNAVSRLRDREVRAPFDGVVGLRNISIGAWVTDETVLTTLDALASLEIEFSAPEIFFSEIAPDTAVLATSPGFSGRTFDGVVKTVDSRIDAATRSFRVRAVIDNPDQMLPAGLFMTVATVLREHDGLVVPEQAVVAEGQSSFVYRIEDNVARRIDIRLGLRGFGEVEVLDGLAEGDLVATTGLQRLRDGAAVSLPAADRGAPAG